MNAFASTATHWCQVGDAYVFLDLHRDRYFMLEQEAASRFAAILRASPDNDAQTWLAERSLQNLAPPIAQSFPGHLDPERSLLDEEAQDKASLSDTAHAIFSLVRAQRHIRRHPLADILTSFSLCRPASEQAQERSVRSAAAAFGRARHYVSGIDKCLSRGVAMRRFLAGRGCEARLVIGVTLPFAAHCWVQWGATVLTDPLDLVTPYEPILVA